MLEPLTVSLPTPCRSRRAGGFTLIELMVVVAVVAVLVVLAAPSLRDMILMQRLRSVNAQLVTDLQFGRSEAAARGQIVRLNFGTDANQTCYVIYTSETSSGAARCNCTLGAGAACPHVLSKEIRTVTQLKSSGVTFELPPTQDTAFGFDHITGGLLSIPSDVANSPSLGVQIDTRIDDDRRLRDKVNQTGRPTVCAPNPTRMGVPSC